MMTLLAWIVAFNTPLGLPAIGAAWRWPHVAMFFVAACVPVGLYLGGESFGNRGLAGVLGGVVVILLFRPSCPSSPAGRAVAEPGLQASPTHPAGR